MAIGQPTRGVIWVAGASSGIGAAIARRLSAEGYTVAASARRSARLRVLARSYPSLHAFPCDCADADAVRRTVEALEERFGAIRALIHCVGTALFKPFLDISPEEFAELIRHNLWSTFLCTRAVLPGMLHQQQGIVVAIGSVASLKAFPRSSAYGGLKAAVAQMLRALREEVRPHGVKIINVHVGATETPLWPATMRRRWRAQMLLPDDVAKTIASLLTLASNPQLLPEELVLRPQLGDLP
ncbi:MAG: SDR family oxidoreductase [Candidatus Kapabacteria bacterium]|nr:SDR family oxidoreductase [Candidatus Kapabacteria bacterium]MDW7997150.1 SDR family oxidoreductase [Bacteroidota bacterium]MDW8224792.1 SDR family oxidoreductase [Bacteroidota bacterium]